MALKKDETAKKRHRLALSERKRKYHGRWRGAARGLWEMKRLVAFGEAWCKTRGSESRKTAGG